MTAYLAFDAELFAECWKKQFDGSSVEADAVIQRFDFVRCVDPLQSHHGHQDVCVLDLARIARKERFDKERPVSLYNVIHPGTRNINTL